jgi:hypothetical protein
MAIFGERLPIWIAIKLRNYNGIIDYLVNVMGIRPGFFIKLSLDAACNELLLRGQAVAIA